MGFGNIAESSSSTDIFAPTEKSPITASGSGVASRGAIKFDTLGTGSYQQKSNFAPILNKGATLVIKQHTTTTAAPFDSKIFESLIDSNQQNLSQILASQGTANEAAESRLGAVLEQIGALAQGKQTGGESTRDKTILYVVLAGVAGLALIFGKRSGFYILAAGAAAYFLFAKKAEAKA